MTHRSGLQHIGVEGEDELDVVACFDAPQRQVLGCAQHRGGHALVIDVAPAGGAFAHVLVGEADLVDGRAAAVARHLHHMHEVVERHVGVGERIDHLAVHGSEPVGQRHVGTRLHAQGQHVDEEAHQVFQGGLFTAAHGGADDEVVLLAHAVQGQGVGGQQGDVERASVLLGLGAQCVGDVLGQVELEGSATARHHGRPRVVDRECQWWRQGCELLAPVAKLALQFGAGHPGVVPGGEVPVTHGQGRQVWLAAFQAGAVELGQVHVQEVEGPRVPDQVVRLEQQAVLIRGEAEQPGGEEGSLLQVIGRLDQLGDDLVHRGLALVGRQLAEVVEGDEAEGQFGQDALHIALRPPFDHGAQHALALHQQLPGPVEGFHIQRPQEAVSGGDAVNDGARREVLEEPDALDRRR